MRRFESLTTDIWKQPSMSIYFQRLSRSAVIFQSNIHFHQLAQGETLANQHDPDFSAGFWQHITCGGFFAMLRQCCFLCISTFNVACSANILHHEIPGTSQNQHRCRRGNDSIKDCSNIYGYFYSWSCCNVKQIEIWTLRSDADYKFRITAQAVTISSTVATQTVTSTTSITTETVNSVTTTTIIEPSISTGEYKDSGYPHVSREVISIDLQTILVVFRHSLSLSEIYHHMRRLLYLFGPQAR